MSVLSLPNSGPRFFSPSGSCDLSLSSLVHLPIPVDAPLLLPPLHLDLTPLPRMAPLPNPRTPFLRLPFQTTQRPCSLPVPATAHALSVPKSLAICNSIASDRPPFCHFQWRAKKLNILFSNSFPPRRILCSSPFLS